MTLDFIKGENWTQTHAGRMSCESESRDQGDASKSQGMLKTTGKPPEAR